MKKRLFVLSVVSLLSLVACGTKKPNQTSESQGTSSNESSSSEELGLSSSETSSSESSSSSSQKELYQVTMEKGEHITASIRGDVTSFAEGDIVQIGIDQVDEKYSFSHFEITTGSDVVNYINVEGLVYSFVMPAHSVTVTPFAELTKYDIDLPDDLPTGISMIISTEEKVLPEVEVKLYVRNEVGDSKRIDAIKLNGDVLEGKRTNEKNCTLYTFTMPESKAEITADIVDVFKVSVKEEFKDIFGLEGNVLAAEGEEVTFIPVFFTNNHWAKNFKAVEEDVVVAPSETKDGAFTFVMPDHAVTIDAEVGYLGHKVIFDTTSPYFTVSIDEAKDAYVTDDVIKFKVTELTVDASVTEVKVNGEVVTKDEDGFYQIVIRDESISIVPTLQFNYKTIEAGVENAFFDMELTTKVDGEEVSTENTVLSNQEIIVSTSRNEEVSEATLVATGLKIFAGSNSKDAAIVTETITDLGKGKFSFKTSSDYMFYKIEVVSEETSFSQLDLIGTYDSGFHPYFSGNYMAKVTASGELYYGSSDGTQPNSKVGELVVDENDPNHFKVGAYDVFSNGKGAMLYLSGVSRGSSYLYAKGLGGSNMNGFQDQNKTYSYMVYGSTVTQQYFQLEGKNGEIVTCFYDYVAKKVTWDVRIQLIQGNNGLTVNDKFFVLDKEDNVLACYIVKTIDSHGNGWQHAVTPVEIDGFADTYTPAEGQEATESISLDGYGLVTVGETKGTYEVVQEKFIKLTLGEEEKFIEVDKEAKTYVASLGPKDGFEGTYLGAEELRVTLDGHGNASIGETVYTYTIFKNYLTLKDSEGNDTYFEFNKEEKTITQVEEISIYANSLYRATWTDTYFYQLDIEFTSGTECKIDLTYGTRSANRTEYEEFSNTGTYTYDENGNVTITTFNTNTNVRLTIELTLNNGKLVVNEEVRVSYYGYIQANATLVEVK